METATTMAMEMETAMAPIKQVGVQRMRNLLRYFSAALTLSVLLGSSTLAQQDKAQFMVNQTAGFSSGAVTPIGDGDLLEMDVFQTPELSGKLRVSDKGNVLVPLIGELHVEGLTALQAQALIRKNLIDGDFIKDPQVTVFISEYATQGVAVMGEVKKPGIYPAFGAHRLLDYLSQAEGLTPLAGTVISITRPDAPDTPEEVKLSAGSTPHPLNNPKIGPGDSIFVQRTGVIYVVGEVFRPGGFPIEHDGHLSVIQAVALAQGFAPTAAKSSAVLIRTTTTGRQEIPVNLKKILTAKATDIELQDNDILFVPSSKAKGVWKTVSVALPTAAGASIYRIP
jgi:polysaccharide export outer membrane protein